MNKLKIGYPFTVSLFFCIISEKTVTYLLLPPPPLRIVREDPVDLEEEVDDFEADEETLLDAEGFADRKNLLTDWLKGLLMNVTMRMKMPFD